jgi:enolase
VVFHTLKKLPEGGRLRHAVGDEGGFAPKFSSDEQAARYIVKAITAAGSFPQGLLHRG